MMVSNTTPSKSYERLIDGKTTPDFEYFNQVLPPELARQIMMGKLALGTSLDYKRWGNTAYPRIILQVQ